MSDVKMLTQSVDYASRGLAVFPLHSVTRGRCSCGCTDESCRSRGKHPRIPAWQKVEADVTQVTNWWTQWPDANIGLALKNDWFVLDVDADHGGLETLRNLELTHGSLPTYMEVFTGSGGRHFYFTLPPGRTIKNSAGAIGPGLDIRAPGRGYVVLPPSIHASGTVYRWSPTNEFDPKPAPEWLLEKSLALPEISVGNRNDSLFRVACRWRADGLEEADIQFKLETLNANLADPLDDEELARITQSALRYTPGYDDGQNIPLTDVGNVTRLVAQSAGQLVHAEGIGFLAWDGKRWNPDKSLVHQHILATFESLENEAQRTRSDDQKKAIQKWRHACGMAGKTDALLRMAKVDTRLQADPATLDDRPWLLNVKNGTLDLQSNRLLPHDPMHRLTKLAPVVYDANARCPRFDRFLHEIFEGRQDLIGFVLRSLGYALTGLSDEHVFWLAYGLGRNGKSVLMDVMLHLLGHDYATEAPFGLLDLKPGDQSTTGFADLRGVRFLAANEVPEGMRLNEARVKQLTGGDLITARNLYKDYITFRPVCKLWILGNHMPVIKDATTSIWERVKPIHFRRQFLGADRDLDLKYRLFDEASGILNRLLEGCRDWQLGGLQVPKEVEDATKVYRFDMDIMGQFLEVRTTATKDPLVELPKGVLYQVYRQWCDTEGHRPMAHNLFSARLREQGWEDGHTGTTRIWRGRALIQETAAAATGGF